MKPDLIKRILYSPEGERGKYTIALNDGLYLTFYPGETEPWQGRGYPIKEPGEEEVTWEQVPSDYQAILLDRIANRR